MLSAIRDYVDKHIKPEDRDYEYKVGKFIDGLKYLLRDGVLRDVHETYILILNGKFENLYLSVEEKYKRYYRHLHRDDYTLNFSSLSFEEQLSRIREQQAEDYIHMGIEALMRSPGLGILTTKNRLKYLLLGYF